MSSPLVSAQPLVCLSVEAGIAIVRLNRPDKLNAVTLAMLENIAATIAALQDMPKLRCVVLTGAGRGFCAGIDLNELACGQAGEGLHKRDHGPANLFQHAAWGWRNLPVPVIAAVQGMAFGAGCQIMLGADLRITTPDAQFSLMELRWGLVPDMAGFALLRGLVRDDVARELVYTARQFSGTEAAALGLVTRLAADPLAEALALAKAIAAQSLPAIRAAKRLLNLPHDPAALLAAESREQEVLLASPEHVETLAAARGQRPPRFED